MIPYRDEYIKYCLAKAGFIMSKSPPAIKTDLKEILNELFHNPSRFSFGTDDSVSLVDRFNKAYVFLLMRIEKFSIDTNILEYNEFISVSRSNKLDDLLD